MFAGKLSEIDHFTCLNMFLNLPSTPLAIFGLKLCSFEWI